MMVCKLPFRPWAVIDKRTKVVLTMGRSREEARGCASKLHKKNGPGRYKVQRVRVTEDYHGG